jgi:hypothetical protein
MVRKGVIAAIVSAVVAVPLGVGVAYASIPAADGTIHGCYQSSGLGDGALYVIDSADSCPSGYTGLNWNQTTASGIAGYEVVSHQFEIPGPRSAGTYSGTVDCPAGKVALGGGAQGATLSWPKSDGSGWEVVVNTPALLSGDVFTFNARVACGTEG